MCSSLLLHQHVNIPAAMPTSQFTFLRKANQTILNMLKTKMMDCRLYETQHNSTVSFFMSLLFVFISQFTSVLPTELFCAKLFLQFLRQAPLKKFYFCKLKISNQYLSSWITLDTIAHPLLFRISLQETTFLSTDFKTKIATYDSLNAHRYYQ